MWYELDVNDRIIAVSDDWDLLSATADLPSNMFEAIKFRPVWDFVEGEETQRFLRAMFFWARNKNRHVVLPYRLDGICGNSFFRMRIEPLHDRGLHIAHSPENLLAAHPHPVVYDTGDMKRCSQCLKVNIDEVWYSVEPVENPAQQAQWCVCPACKEQALSLLDRKFEAPVASYAYAGFSKL